MFPHDNAKTSSPLTPTGEAQVLGAVDHHLRQAKGHINEAAHLGGLMQERTGKAFRPEMAMGQDIASGSSSVRDLVAIRAKELRRMADDLEALSAALPQEIPPQAASVLRQMLQNMSWRA